MNLRGKRVFLRISMVVGWCCEMRWSGARVLVKVLGGGFWRLVVRADWWKLCDGVGSGTATKHWGALHSPWLWLLSMQLLFIWII